MMNNVMVTLIDQIWKLDSGNDILCNVGFDWEWLIKIDPVYLDMSITNIGLSFWKVVMDNIGWFTEFLNLLLDPKSIYMWVKEFSENIKPNAFKLEIEWP